MHHVLSGVQGGEASRGAPLGRGEEWQRLTGEVCTSELVLRPLFELPYCQCSL